MKRSWKRFLAAILSLALLLSVTAAAAPATMAPQQEPKVENIAQADFTGTNGPDDLDALYPSTEPKSRAASDLTDIKNIVILVNFSGLDEFVTPARTATLQDIYNTRSNSLKGYLAHATYNTIDVTTSFYPKTADGTAILSYVDPHPIEYYKVKSESNPLGYEPNERFPREAELLTGAFNYVKAQVEAEYTGAQLDNNNDGSIDSLAILVNGYRGTGGGINWNDLLWPHKYSRTSLTSSLTMNGKYLGGYNLLLADIPPSGDGGLMSENADNAQYTVIIHEFLHTLGLHDLYHYSAPGSPVGDWDIMGYTYSDPQNLLQYMQREYMGWGKPIHEVTTSGTQTLQAAKYQNADTDGGYDGSPEAAVILRSPFSTTEFFVVEYRVKTGFDSKLPGEGLIIYRVDESVTSCSNASAPPDYLYIFRPGETSITPGGVTSRAYYSQQSGRTAIGKPLGEENVGFDGNTLYYGDGVNSGIVIDQIGAAGGDTITFRVTFPPEIAGSGTPSDPYQVSLPGHLNYMAEHPEKYYKLTRDIDCASLSGFTPIPNFTGSFDGNGHTIKNLRLTGSAHAQAGLFAVIGADGSVQNLTLKDFTITGTQSVGILAGTIAGSAQRIQILGGSARNTASATGEHFAGGLCGTAQATANIIGCITSAAPCAQTAGGLCGLSQAGARWQSCYASGAVSGIDGNSICNGLIGKQMVGITYIPGNSLYWNAETSGSETAATVVKSADIAYTGLEGMTGISMNSSLRLGLGKSAAIPLRTLPEDVTLNGTWAIEDTTIASLENGTVTGILTGNTNVTYTIPLYGSISVVLTCTIEVVSEEFAITALQIVQGSMYLGSRLTFRATVSGAFGGELFSYYLFHDGKVCYKAVNITSNSITYTPMEAGDYLLICYCRNPDEEMVSKSIRFSMI